MRTSPSGRDAPTTIGASPYLTALSSRLTRTCWILFRSPDAAPDFRDDLGLDRQRLVDLGLDRLDGGADHLGDVDRLLLHLELAPVELARDQDLVGDPRQPRGLLGDHPEQHALAVLGELDVVAEQRERSAVDRGHRRPELVRDRGHEVAALLVEPPLRRDVAERVDHTLRAADRDERQPEVAFRATSTGSVAGLGRGAAARRPGSARRALATPGSARRAACPAPREPGEQLGGAVPELDDALVVDEEDPVADGLEHVRRLLALSGHRPRRRLGRLEAPRSCCRRALRTAAAICATSPSKSSSCSSRVRRRCRSSAGRRRRRGLRP